MPTRTPNFNFLPLIVSEIKRMSQNLMWGLLRPCRTPYAETFTYTPSTWQGKTASQISASYLYASCSYANMYFPLGFPLYVPKNGFFGGFEGEDVKIMCPNPQKALPCVNTRLLVYRVSKSVQRPELYGSVERFCVQRKKKKWVVTLAIWGEVTPAAILTKCRLCGRNHVCNISWLSVNGCGCGERGKFAFSHWLDASPLQHWSHYRVTVWLCNSTCV